MPDSAFEVWYSEREGFSLRAERLTGPKDELQAAFEAGVAAERERCAKVAELYSEVSWEKCTDSILLDPVLSNRGRRPLTSEDWKRAEDMAVDGTIASAAYHAANHIAETIRNP